MTDSTWDDYQAQDAAAELVELEGDVSPVLDAAGTDAWQADNAESWADWHSDIAEEATADAASELNYANDQYAAGFDGAGDAARGRAEIAMGTAADEGSVAGDYYSTSADEAGDAAAGYETAEGYVDDAADSLTDSAGFDPAGGLESSGLDSAVDTSSSYDATDYGTDDTI